MKEKSTLQKRLQGFATICPFQNYVLEKEKFKKSFPDVKIIEEIKSLFVGQVEVPDPTLIGRTKSAQTLMIAWAVVYEEYVTEDKLLN